MLLLSAVSAILENGMLFLAVVFIKVWLQMLSVVWRISISCLVCFRKIAESFRKGDSKSGTSFINDKNVITGHDLSFITLKHVFYSVTNRTSSMRESLSILSLPTFGFQLIIDFAAIQARQLCRLGQIRSWVCQLIYLLPCPFIYFRIP